jgi:aldehyde:ferredoxin oxidoreductase
VGFGTKVHDYPPYRAMGPVTADEYESRQERYDGQLKDFLDLDTEGMSTEEKMARLREYRESQYEQLLQVVYKRRGWTQNGVPTPEKLKDLGIDIPEVIRVVQQHS